MIICEVGLNHNGNEKYAKEYVDAVIKSKTDAIAFHIREESFYHGKNKKKKLSDGFYRNAREKVRKEKIKFYLFCFQKKNLKSKLDLLS